MYINIYYRMYLDIQNPMEQIHIQLQQLRMEVQNILDSEL